ncbi:hypothetical protein DSL72_006281 [Monilinia vaccinii-corymbosi]|uniref:Cyanovirin-N domain-containing protein n=1 Tax=Monilinia vaccinii-corymbosi TaxID=61207 RepID=A0A8A3PNA7_9HELO|nr:hypothetical protein DSL72_006281 [Monilinia vaccinii-corymbosi]
MVKLLSSKILVSTSLLVSTVTADFFYYCNRNTLYYEKDGTSKFWTWLMATCRSTSAGYTWPVIDLSKCISNNNGVLEFNSDPKTRNPFSKSCSNCGVQDGIFSCEVCVAKDGRLISPAGLLQLGVGIKYNIMTGLLFC